MPEWSIGAVCKTAALTGYLGSNPSLGTSEIIAARYIFMRPDSSKIVKAVVKVFLLVSVPVILSYLLIYLYPVPAFSFKREEIVAYVSGFKQFAPLIYIVFQTASVLVVPVPSAILATAGGAIFGFWQAVPYTTFAWIVGTSINFFIARILGRLFLQRMMRKEELALIDRFADSIGWKLIFFSWFIPGGTADVAGYAAGLTKMTYWKYFIPALTSAFLLAIVTSAAGTAFVISPILTTIITIGAAFGILFGVKLLVVVSFTKKIVKFLKKKFFQKV